MAPAIPIACHQPESTRLEDKPLPHVRAAEVVLVQPRPESRHLVPLEPLRRTRLAPRVGGQVKAIEVDEQDTVDEGDVLVRFAGDDPRGGLMSAQASIDRLRESLRDTTRELETARTLARQGAETTRSVERLETDEATLQAQLREAKGSLVQARDRVGATAIVAPFAGTITEIDTELGEYMAPGSVAMVLAQLDPLALEVPLTQDEVARSDVGGLSFTVLARGKPRTPELEWIANEAEAGSTTFPARLRLPNPAGELRAGELVDVEVYGAAEPEVTAVPATAVRWAADQAYVLRIDGETVARTDIEVRDDTRDLVVIAGPIEAGQRVVAAGPIALVTGDRVQVVDAPEETLASQ